MEDKKLTLELEEKIIGLRKGVEVNKIEPKDMARFCAVFYKKFGDNYNEKEFVELCKRIMYFFNTGIKNIPDENKNFSLDRILEKCEDVQNRILKSTKKSEIDYAEDDENVSLENFNYEELKEEYNLLYHDYDEESKKKLFFWLAKIHFSKKPYEYYRKFEKIKRKILGFKKAQEEQEIMVNLEKEHEKINAGMKSIVMEVNPEIGIVLESFRFKEIIAKEATLKDYIMKVLIKNLYGYFQGNTKENIEENNNTEDSDLKDNK